MQQLKTILPYKLDKTNDLLTSRAGLLSIAQLMNSLKLSERIDHHFPLPNSNRGFLPSQFIKTLILMQHEGSFHLDDVRNIDGDTALRTVLGLKQLPKATTLGDWLRRAGNHDSIQDAWVSLNQAVLQSALHHRKEVTLDIDATEIVSNLFALMRLLLPERLSRHRAMTIRWRLYAMAAKVVRTGRQIIKHIRRFNTGL